MIEITYLDASKQERTVTFESYEEFERSQHALPDWCRRLLPCPKTNLQWSCSGLPWDLWGCFLLSHETRFKPI